MGCKRGCGMMCKCKIRAAFFNCEDDGVINVQTFIGNPGCTGPQCATLTGQAELSVSDGCCGGANNLQFWTNGSIFMEATQGSAKVVLETNNIFVASVGFTGDNNPPVNVGIPALGFDTADTTLAVWVPAIQAWLHVNVTGSSIGATGAIGATGGIGVTGAVGFTGAIGPTGG